MHFFLYEIVARIVAIYLCVDASRELWNGLAEGKIGYFNSSLIDGFFISWSKWFVQRGAAPIRYWIQIGFRVIMVAACGFVAIFGWWQQPNA